MLSCREVTQLASEMHDRKLPFRQRLSLRIHLSMCRICRAYAKQIEQVRGLMRDMAGGANTQSTASNVVSEPAVALTDEQKATLQDAIGEAIAGHDKK